MLPFYWYWSPITIMYLYSKMDLRRMECLRHRILHRNENQNLHGFKQLRHKQK